MSLLLDLLFNNPYVPWILLLLGVLVLYQKFGDRLKIQVPGGGLGADVLGRLLGPGYAQAKLDRAVARLKKQENWLAAGKMLEDAERPAQAAEAYIEGKEFWAAAATYEKMGRGEKAAELYLQAGDYKKSAALLVNAGKPARAAVLFLEKGNNLEAARLFGLAGQWDKAAELYAKSGYPLRAAEAFEKQGELIKAAEAYEQHFMENVTYSTTYSATAQTADHKSALMAGRLYEKAGDLSRAFQVYNKGSYFKQAAQALSKLGQHAKAAEMFLRAEDHASAAAAYQAAGDVVQASTLRGEVAFKADRPAEAAAHFVTGRDFLRAAELFESVGMLAEAAGAYEAGESWAAAGSVYIRAGLPEKAASSYERAGELETAAKLYEEAGRDGKAIELYGKAGLTFKSGEAAARAGEREKAIALLQRVGAADENYRAATELLARLFVESRMPALAIERVQKAIAGQPVSAGNLELYYWLAIGHEASGDVAGALATYKKIQAEDLQFRDVNQRAARLEGGGTAAARPAAPATGAAPAPPPAAAAPRPPRFLTREEVGRGPLGAVYRAEDSADGRSVALRVLPAELMRGDLVPALVADLKAAAAISHPNVVKVLGLVEVKGQRCLVTELVPGKNFGEALRAGRRMSFQQVHGLGRVLAQTLSTVHAKGLVHGSIQPSNIMVSSGVIKVADLGLGRLAHTLACAESYRAPENRLDVAGDLYAAAAVLYHLLTGTHPKSQAQGAALPLPSSLASGVPESLDKLLLRCLHPREDLRLATADDLLAGLREMVKIG